VGCGGIDVDVDVWRGSFDSAVKDIEDEMIPELGSPECNELDISTVSMCLASLLSDCAHPHVPLCRIRVVLLHGEVYGKNNSRNGNQKKDHP
jgi:hypothetical protein